MVDGKQGDMWLTPPGFPERLPDGYRPLDDEPLFDPGLHLAPEAPGRVWTLADFGYDAEEQARAASPVAISTPFRLLSPAGVAAMRQVALQLRAARQASTRTASYVAGGVYRSCFLRALCNHPAVAAVMSRVARCALVAHSMPSQQAYINYAPEELGKAVDTWHTDGIGFDYVLLLSDPASFEGGAFQFFRGTRQEAAALLDVGVGALVEANARDLPPARVETVRFPAAGYAIFQQGSHVVHRATALTRVAERITLVPGLVARDLAAVDPTRDAVAGWGEPGIEAEFARHKACLAQGKLRALIAELGRHAPPADLAAALRAAVADASHAADVLERLRTATAIQTPTGET